MLVKPKFMVHTLRFYVYQKLNIVTLPLQNVSKTYIIKTITPKAHE